MPFIEFFVKYPMAEAVFSCNQNSLISGRMQDLEGFAISCAITSNGKVITNLRLTIPISNLTRSAIPEYCCYTIRDML